MLRADVGDRGLGALICEKFAQEGCNIVVNYNLSPDRAKEVAEKCRGYGVKVGVVQGVRQTWLQFSSYTMQNQSRISTAPLTLIQDAGIAKDNARLVQETVDILGGLDIIVANAGWTRFSNFADLNALSDEEWNKCWATNVMAHLQLLQKAGPIFKENPEGGVYLITSSVAVCSKLSKKKNRTSIDNGCKGTNPGGSSMAYSVTKAAALHLMRCIGEQYIPCYPKYLFTRTSSV